MPLRLCAAFVVVCALVLVEMAATTEVAFADPFTNCTQCHG
jgi:hypothetical protein